MKQFSLWLSSATKHRAWGRLYGAGGDFDGRSHFPEPPVRHSFGNRQSFIFGRRAA